MAIIPRFDERIGQTLRSDVIAPAVRSYTMPARNNQLENLGGVVMSASSQVAALYQQNMEREAANYASKASSTLYESSTAKMAAAKERALATGNITGFTQSLVDEYQKDAEKLIANAPNFIARDLVANRVRQTAASLGAEAMKFEATEKVRMYKSDLNVAADKYAKAAAIDPTQIPEIFRQLEGDLQGARATLGVQETDLLAKTYKNNIVSSAISRALASEDIQGARNLLASYQEDLSSRDYVSFANNVDILQRRLEARAQTAENIEGEISRAWAAVNGGLPLDPTKAKDRRAMDLFYIHEKEKNPNLDFTDIAIQARILPPTMRNDLYTKLAGGDSIQKAMAANSIHKIHSLLPELLKGFDSKTKAKALLISKSIDAGVDPRKAVEWADNQTAPALESVIKQRTQDVNSGRVKLSFDNVQRQFTGLFGGIASPDAIPYRMKGEYTELARSYYINEGLSPKDAREAALNDLKANWSLTGVFGNKRYMKHAPEIEYGNGVEGNAWLYDQFKEAVLNAELIHGLKFKEEDLKNMIIDVDPDYVFRGDGEEDGQPLYNFYIVHPDTGIFDIVLDKNNQPLRFMPDFTKTDTYKRAMKEVIELEQQAQEQEKSAEERYEEYIKEERAKSIARQQPPYFGDIFSPLVKEAKKGEAYDDVR